jgi:hypothetical protein
MSKPQEDRQTAVEQVRRVRDQLNREIEAMTGQELLDHLREHRYASPALQRLASKAARKTEASGTASGSR